MQERNAASVQQERMRMMYLMWPGDFVANLAGLEAGSENRQVLRMFANTVFYSIAGILAILPFVL
jgi:hypothetical protein